MGEKCGKWSFLRHYAAKDVHERHLRKLNWTWTSAYTRKLKKHRKLCGTKTKLSRDISVIALYAGVWICNRGNSEMLESIPRLTFSSSHSVSLFPSWICWTLFIQKSSKVIKKSLLLRRWSVNNDDECEKEGFLMIFISAVYWNRKHKDMF